MRPQFDSAQAHESFGLRVMSLEGLGNLSQHKLEELRKATSKLLKNRKKRYKYTKYGNMNKGFTDSELKRFLSSCRHPKAYLAFLMQSHLGLRVSEVARVKLSDIDWHNNKIRISTLKACTGDFLFMPKPVRIQLLTWVQKYSKEIEKSGGFIFYNESNKNKRPHASPDWLRNEFRRTCILANLNEWYDYAEDGKNPIQKDEGSRKLHRFSTHSLRHYFITKCYGHCKNPMLTQKLARHQDFRNTQRYINVNYEKLGKVIEDVFEPKEAKEREELMEFMQVYAKWKENKMN